MVFPLFREFIIKSLYWSKLLRLFVRQKISGFPLRYFLWFVYEFEDLALFAEYLFMIETFVESLLSVLNVSALLLKSYPQWERFFLQETSSSVSRFDF